MDNNAAISRILSLVGIALLLVGSTWVERHWNTYLVQVLSFCAINVIFAVGFNLVYGIAGQFSLAHAGVAAIGGYTVGLLALSAAQKADYFLLAPPVWPISVLQLPFVPSLILAGVLACAVGLVVGIPALRLRGDYLLMATLGFSEIIRLVLCNMPGLCNAALGLKGIPRRADLVWQVGLAAVVVFIAKRLVDSDYGNALKGIREDEIAAEALGINLFKHKLLAFGMSCFFVGIGGALLVDSLGAVDPGTFKPALTYATVTMVVLGGVGSITGSVIGAVLYTLLSEALRPLEYSRTFMGITTPDLPGLRTVVFAITLIVLMLFYRKGIMGTREFSWRSTLAALRDLIARKSGEGKVS